MTKLKSGARVGNTVFKAGVDESLVIACAQRLYDNSITVSENTMRQIQKEYDKRPTLEEMQADSRLEPILNKG